MTDKLTFRWITSKHAQNKEIRYAVMSQNILILGFQLIFFKKVRFRCPIRVVTMRHWQALSSSSCSSSQPPTKTFISLFLSWNVLFGKGAGSTRSQNSAADCFYWQLLPCTLGGDGHQSGVIVWTARSSQFSAKKWCAFCKNKIDRAEMKVFDRSWYLLSL